MNPLRLEKRVPEENQYRFYRLLPAPTLFGEWSLLIREWGRIGQPGTVRVDLFATLEEAAAAQAKKAVSKLRTDYLQTIFDR